MMKRFFACLTIASIAFCSASQAQVTNTDPSSTTKTTATAAPIPLSPELIQRLEARGVDVNRLQQRMAENGRDGSALRQRLQASGVDVDAAKARIQSGGSPPTSDRPEQLSTRRQENRLVAGEQGDRSMWPQWFGSRDASSQAVSKTDRVQQNRTPAERRAAINTSMQDSGIDRQQWRDQAAQMTPEERASRRESVSAAIRARRDR
jgi:hypothetical protein